MNSSISIPSKRNPGFKARSILVAGALILIAAAAVAGASALKTADKQVASTPAEAMTWTSSAASSSTPTMVYFIAGAATDPVAMAIASEQAYLDPAVRTTIQVLVADSPEAEARVQATLALATPELMANSVNVELVDLRQR